MKRIKSKPKFKERKKYLRFPVFIGYKIVLIITNDLEKTRDRICNKHNIKHNNEDFGAMHIWTNNPATSYIILPTGANVSDIAHESWHAVQQMMCHFAGGEMDNEIVAYTIGYVVQEAYDLGKK